MIRKTLICIVGALAGASTGAYHDGFFERENVVTNAYNTAYEEVVSRYNEFSSPDGTTDADLVASHLGGKVMEPSTSAVSTSSVDKTTEDLSASENSSATPAHESGMSDAKSKIMRMSKEGPTELADAASDATDEMGSASKQTEEDQASSNDEVASKDSADEMKATEEKSALAAAKEMALLDVRFSKETFESPSGGELKYRKLSPRTAGAGQPLPLIVFLHGAQQRGDDNVSQLQHGLSFIASREGMQQFPATIIAPQCPKQTRWTTTLENRPGKGELDPVPSEVARMTLELIDSMQFTGNIDPDRIYITGLSMGGFGTFDLISRRPSTFAAAVPLCGGGDTSPTVINRIKQTPLWVIHGDEDPVVRVKYSRQMVKALRAADAPVRYSELAGYKHNIWDAAYADKELYKWMFNQSKSGPINSVAKRTQPKDAASKRVAKKTAKPSQKTAAAAETKRRKSTQSVSRPATSAETIQKSLQNEWKVLAATRKGRRADAATLAKMRVVFKDDSLTIAIGERSESAKYKLSKSKDSPYPEIDMISQRKGIEDSAGIFAMQGNKLVICWAVPGGERPKTFDSRDGVKTLVLEKL